jgi:tetratricopeptide (TPR) repeat protein
MIKTRTISNAWAAAVILAFCLAAGAPALSAEEKKELLPIPTIKPDNLEESVKKHLIESRKMVESVIGRKDVDPKVRASSYGELGQTYHAYDLVDAAEACYRNAVVLDPGSYDWNYSLGFLLLKKKGEYLEALDYFRRAAKLVKDDDGRYLVNIRIGECYLPLNRQREAGEAFGAAYRINPEGAAVLARMGETALAEKRFQDAINYLSKALQAQPAANRLHYRLAMAYRGAGEAQNARFHLSKRGMVGVQPPDPLTDRLKHLVTGYRVHLLAGRLAYSAKRYEDAAAEFRKAVAANPKKPAGHTNLGVTLANLRRYKEAIVEFEETLKLEPGNLTVHFNLGTLYGFLGQFEKAAQHLQAVVDKSPGDAQAHVNLGNVLRKLKRYDEALKLYETATRLKPSLQMGWLNMFAVYMDKRQYKEALGVLEAAYKQLPHDGHICHALARQLAISPRLQLRDGKRALELALKVYSARRHYETARTVSAAYAELNKCDEAIQWLEQAIMLAQGQKEPVLASLQQSLEFLKANRPCRIPGEK